MITLISRYSESLEWLEGKMLNGYIINKGSDLIGDYENIQVIKHENYGANQFDLLNFICENYYKLPNLMMFIQGNPFDHCRQDVFWEMVASESPCFLDTSYLGKKNRAWRFSQEIDCGFTEKNNSWYVYHFNRIFHAKCGIVTCNFRSFDEFMGALFPKYRPISWVRFSPGSQYIVSSAQCLRYSLKFWETLRDFIPKDSRINGGVEAHLIERALGLIFMGIYAERESFDLQKFTPSESHHYLYSSNQYLEYLYKSTRAIEYFERIRISINKRSQIF